MVETKLSNIFGTTTAAAYGSRIAFARAHLSGTTVEISGTTVESRHTPRHLSRQPPPASWQFSFSSSTGSPHSNGARSKFSARQSPSLQSALTCNSGNVVAISQAAPDPLLSL